MFGKTALLIILLVLPIVTAEITVTDSIGMVGASSPSPPPPPSPFPTTMSSGGGGGGHYGVPRYYCRKINLTAIEPDGSCVHYNTTCEVPIPIHFVQEVKRCPQNKTIIVNIISPAHSSGGLSNATVSVVSSVGVTNTETPPLPPSEPIPAVPPPVKESNVPFWILMVILIIALSYFAYRRFQTIPEKKSKKG